MFSCITGILGVCVVAWYGMSQPIKARDHEPLVGSGNGEGQAGDGPSDTNANQTANAAPAAETTGAEVRSS